MLTDLSLFPHIYSIALLCFVAEGLTAQEISFRNDVAPVLLANCYGCHNERTAEGSYRVDSFASLLKPGDSGETPIVGGKAKQSELLRRLTTEDEDERMPLEGDPLAMPTIELMRKWIGQGAKYDADDRSSSLASILPITKHPEPPNTYRFPIAVTAITFIGDELLVGGYHELLRWNWKERKIVARIAQVGQRIYRIEFDERSGRIYVGSGTPAVLGEVRIVDAESHELVGVPLITNDVVLDVALDPAGQLLAAAGADRQIHLIDLQANRVVRSIDSHSDWVHAVAWSEDGTTLASASRDKTAKLFAVASGEPKRTYREHDESVVDVDFVFDKNDQLVSCDSKGRLHLWKAEDGKKTKDLPANGDRAFGVLPMRDGVWLASTSSSLAQLAWDGKQVLRKFDGYSEWVTSMATDRESKWLATGDLAGRVRVWDLETNKLLVEFPAFPRK